jgi:hypothetical protein
MRGFDKPGGEPDQVIDVLHRHGADAPAISQLMYTEAKKLYVVFSQGKPLLATFMRTQ